MIIKRGETYTDNGGKSSTDWRELVDECADSPYGRIVAIGEIDQAAQRLVINSVEWFGPEPARLSARLLYDMGIEAYDLSYGDNFWVGPFYVGLLDFNQGFRECLVYRLNGNLSQRINIVLFRLRRLANTIEERLRWTAAVWNLIPQRVTEPEWKDLRPYQWLRRVLAQ